MDYDYMGSLVENLMQHKTIIIVAAAFMVVYLIVLFFINKRKKEGNAKFLAANPSAATIYLQYRVGVTAETMSIFSVDGAPAQLFYHKGKTGVYVLPGQRALEVEYNYQRPGVMHKTVTETTGRVKKVVETEANGVYLLGFDRKAGGFTLARHQV